MRIRADRDLCQGHGICVLEAPEVFGLRGSEDGTYDTVDILNETPDSSLRSKVDAAVRFCPNRVLSVVDED
jgi:ferredoxin